ncbi:MAG TPA: glycosyltransferase family 1 protein [Chthoniobacterales bacterium]
MKSVLEVYLLPAYPAEGSHSMDNYWRALMEQAAVFERGGVSIQSALGIPPGQTRRRSRGERFMGKYLAYPLRAARIARGQRVHLLDHSFAHLLRFVPKSCPKLVTVHDLVPLVDGRGLNGGQIARFRKTVECLRRADRLLAVSRFTAQALETVLSIPAARIQVIPMGVSVPVELPPRPAPDPSVFRLLSIGSGQARKNLDLLPEVIAPLIGRGRRLQLVRIGSPLSGDLRERLGRLLEPQDLVERGEISVSAVKEEYRKAGALLFPSTLEGFGLPLLEAMAQGCPVISSNASSLPEVGGDAVLYFSPADPLAAAAQVEKLILSPDLARSLIEAGRQRARTFDWAVHAARLSEVYREMGGY